MTETDEFADPATEYTIAIVVRHPFMDVRAFSEELQLEAHVAWSKGDRNAYPNGVPFDGLRRSSYWLRTYIVDSFGYKNVGDRILEDISPLVAHRALFARLADEGGELNVNLGFSGDAHIGFELSAECIDAIRASHFRIGVEFFSVRQNWSYGARIGGSSGLER